MKLAHNSGQRRAAAQMHALAAVRREIRLHGSPGPRKYLHEFTQAFRKFDRLLTRAELHDRIGAADLVLVGDYHALPASQQFAASLIERIAASRPLVLGVEAILSRDQYILDQWWRREIGEEHLRERLRFDREWGYEWAPSYELLSTARDRAEAIYGLDCMPRHDMRRIRSRDRHAAEKIREMRACHANAVMVVLFGESHMAPEHLPRALQYALPGENVLTILQNIDALYWQAVGDNAAAVALGEDAVCVFNSTPLEKYESYRLCLERWHTDDAPDFTPAVHNLILSLARSLGFRADSLRNGTQPKYLADSLPEVVCVEQDGVKAIDESQRTLLEKSGCVYVPQVNTVFVREFTMAHAAREAARFLYHARKAMPQDYSQTNLENALAHFGSRLMCPGTLDKNSPSDPDGEDLYRKYLAGSISKAELRRMFLARTNR
jgi:hypothetical protein